MVLKSGRRPRSKAEVEETRAKIVAKALKLFQEEGYASVSIRRLAKEAGCAPMTIYAHFEGKIDILRHLWADVLNAVFEEIQTRIKDIETPRDKLRTAARIFVEYWLQNNEHFRLVFMSNDISRPDVGTFVEDETTQKYFRFFETLVKNSLPSNEDTRARTDTLICSLIGIVFCGNTIRDYPWTQATIMTEFIVASLVSR